LTHAFNDWLPFDAISDPSFTILFDPIIEAWAKRWFHTTNVGVLAIKPTGANKVQLSSIAGRAINDCANVSWNDDIAMALACAALDTTTDGNKLTTDDQKLIEAFAGKVLADLGKDLADFLGGSADILPPGEVTPRHPADGLELAIGDSLEAPLLKLFIAGPALYRRRKQLCSRYLPERIEASTVVDILAPVPIAFVPLLGKATMDVSDLRGMAEGDVVVLDRMLTDALDIVGEGSGRLLFKAKLEQHDGSLALMACEIKG
jgi:flagellar motor switch/type III secretory pathway protein FliN